MTRSATTRPLAAIAMLVTACCGGAHAQPGIDPESGIDALRNARDVQIQVQDFAAALDPARRVVEAMQTADDPLVGDDLLRLAEVQAGLREFDDAEETFLQAIEALTERDGITAPSLITAYQGLGRNYVNDRRFDEALVAFEEARTISRRAEGLFNVDQASIIDDMTLAYLGTGNTTEARDLQIERLDTAIRRFGADDARVIPFHTHLGDYLDNSRLRIGAREQYERALEISEQQFGQWSTPSLALLRRLAEIDLLLDRDSDVHERLATGLREAGTLDPIERARTLLTLGDRALIYEGPAAAAPRYQEAWDLLSAHEAVDAAAVFANPQPLNLVPPLSAVDRGARRDPWSWGDLVMSFDVSAEGRAGNVSVVEMTPENEGVANDYSRRIREAYFRPRLVDGIAVGTADVRYRQNFRYYVRD